MGLGCGIQGLEFRVQGLGIDRLGALSEAEDERLDLVDLAGREERFRVWGFFFSFFITLEPGIE